MSKHHPTSVVQPEIAAALKVQHTTPMSRGGHGGQAQAQMGALPSVVRKPWVSNEEDEVTATQTADAGSEGLRVANTELAPLPVEKGAQQLAQLVQAPVAAGSGGVGAGVTGVGLAGVPGSSVAASLGAAGVQTVAAVWSVPGWLAVGAAGAVGIATTTNSLQGDDTAPSVTPAQSFSYSENSANGASVGTVAATDNMGVTGFRFSATGTSTSADGYFSIGDSGAVTLTQAGAAAGVASNDFETGDNSFTYGVQARDAAGNWSTSADVTFNVTNVDEAPPVDDWVDSYAEDYQPGIDYGPHDFSGAEPAAGYIEVAGDLDVFDASNVWWNGVYEITVTGQLTTDDLTLHLLDPWTDYQPLTQDGVVNLTSGNDGFLMTLNNNAGSRYEESIASYFRSRRDYLLEVGAEAGKTGSYSLSIDLIDDYADQIVLDNGQMRPNYGPTADATQDLGLGVIVKTNPYDGTGKAVEGLFNYQGDIDIWKYAGTAGEFVSVSLSVVGAALSVLDHQGNALQAIDDTYILTGDTYLHVMHGAAAVGSSYRLEVLPGVLVV